MIALLPGSINRDFLMSESQQPIIIICFYVPQGHPYD